MEATSRRTAMTAAGLLVIASLAACGSSNADNECAAAYENAALAVAEVVSVDIECESPLGDPSQSGTIVLSVNEQDQATQVIEDVYREFAAEGALDGSWRPLLRFESEDGETEFREPIFEWSNGSPAIDDFRDHWGIHPARSEY